MREVAVAGSVPRFELAEWRERYGVVAGITGRGSEEHPFDLGLAGMHAPVGAVLDRWQALLSAVPGFHAVIVSRQVHGTRVLWHDTGAGLTILQGADGHATGSRGVLLAVTAADCVPVYLIDPGTGIVALVHAGWRGTAGGIVGNALDLMVGHGAAVENVLVHCGPAICGQCYEVGSEVFAGCGVEPPASGKGPIDLRAVLTAQACGWGVQTVSTSQFCSVHDAGRFFSHRGSGGADGRMVAYLGFPA